MTKITEITEKMPPVVKETIGQAQARLTTWEGEARKMFTTTWTRIHDWHKTRINQVENTTTEWHSKTLHGIGLATQSDIERMTKQISRLRSDVKKISRKSNTSNTSNNRNRSSNTKTKTSTRTSNRTSNRTTKTNSRSRNK
ncbi:MAG: hypothetical protein JRF33_25035 [Deltaproteobacteria bacterium]|nr:hypothetical protein [Deltaproteobacteria bacterium]